MISFIVIGRNEARNIGRCIVSLIETINVNKLKDAEILYVDSNSGDGTVSIVQKYAQVIIYKITKGWNLPVARNIGANHAKGDILFFIDGDMALEPSFVRAAISDGALKCDFVTGALYEYQFNLRNDLVNQYWRTRSVVPVKRTYFTCGVFLIKKTVWRAVNGMDTRMKKGADIDLSMRLYHAGIALQEMQDKCADHYTISYLHRDRLWSTLFNGDVLYAKSVVYRRYITTFPMLKMLLTSDYTALLLVASCILTLTVSPLVFIVYAAAILFKTVKQRGITFLNRLALIPYYLTRDLMVLGGILLFYPRKPNYEYIKLQ